MPVFQSRTPTAAEVRAFAILLVLYAALAIGLLPWARQPGLANPRIVVVANTAIMIADICTAILLAAWY